MRESGKEGEKEGGLQEKEQKENRRWREEGRGERKGQSINCAGGIIILDKSPAC